MAQRQPIESTSISGAGAPPPPWSHARRRLAEGATRSPSLNGTYWLATAGPDGRPHAMPVFAIWHDDALYFCSAPTARKTRHLARNPYCAVTAATGDLDVVLEGEAHRVTDPAELHAVADGFGAKYDWPLRVNGDLMDADYGAPSSGGPPFQVFRLTPSTVYGLGTTEPYGAARWRF